MTPLLNITFSVANVSIGSLTYCEMVFSILCMLLLLEPAAAAADDDDDDDDHDVLFPVYVLPEVGMLTTLVYKLTGKCKTYMKNEKLSELQQLICPASKKEANPCRYEMHAVCAEHAENVRKIMLGHKYFQKVSSRDNLCDIIYHTVFCRAFFRAIIDQFYTNFSY